VIPRFRGYAPGLDPDTSVCGVHVFDTRDGRIIASLVWPQGNQVFGIDWAPAKRFSGFPFKAAMRGTPMKTRNLFYTFAT
jgi:hypothetical protein